MSNVVGEETFKLILRLEIQKASRLRYSLCLISLSPDSLSAGPTPDLSSRVAEVFVGSLRSTDVATVLADSSVALLLIDAETTTVQTILDRTALSMKEARIDELGSSGLWSLSAGASCYPKSAVSGDELLAQAEALRRRARTEGGGRLCLPV